jgi:uncharacterized protein (DUF433 family)
MNENLLKRIAVNPEIFNGKPIIRGMRIKVENILALLEQGEKSLKSRKYKSALFYLYLYQFIANPN